MAAASTAVEVETLLAEETARVEAALASIRGSVMERFPPALAEAVRYALESSGKRLRPILCAVAYRASLPDGGGTREEIYRLACALELVHTYSLVHDDLPAMDDDDLRRGRPTLHRVCGTGMAIVAGASLLPLAAQLLEMEGERLGLSAAEQSAMAAELFAAAGLGGMVTGQFLDLEGESGGVDAGALEAIHRAKTGALLAASLRLGARAAGAPDRVRAALTEYGTCLGLAFQITDDVLDETGTSQALGKTAGKDRSAGKATYPTLYGVDGARRLAERWTERATAALEGAGVRSPALEALARYVVARQR